MLNSFLVLLHLLVAGRVHLARSCLNCARRACNASSIVFIMAMVSSPARGGADIVVCLSVSAHTVIDAVFVAVAVDVVLAVVAAVEVAVDVIVDS